jgi:hypothetical protein
MGNSSSSHNPGEPTEASPLAASEAHPREPPLDPKGKIDCACTTVCFPLTLLSGAEEARRKNIATELLTTERSTIGSLCSV